MKANELRIGNVVNATALYDKINLTVKSIVVSDRTVIFFHDCHAGEYIEDIQPIPLADDWLKRAGFKVREESFCKEYYIGTNEVTHDWLFSLTWLIMPELINVPNAPFYRNGGHQIYFVHQLQNLYFALTGEELTFTEL